MDVLPRTAEAVYEDQCLRLDEPLPLNEQQRVLVVVMPLADMPAGRAPSADEMLRLDISARLRLAGAGAPQVSGSSDNMPIIRTAGRQRWLAVRLIRNSVPRFGIGVNCEIARMSYVMSAASWRDY
jgi:hypothetical protein